MASPLIIGVVVALLAVAILGGSRRVMMRLRQRSVRRRRLRSQSQAAVVKAERQVQPPVASPVRLPAADIGPLDGEGLRQRPTGSG
jgi:hypothetical protein